MAIVRRMDNVAWLFGYFAVLPFVWIVAGLIVVALVAVVVTVVVRRQPRVSAYSDRITP